MLEYFCILLSIGPRLFSFLTPSLWTGIGFRRVLLGITGVATTIALSIHLAANITFDFKSFLYVLSLISLLFSYVFLKEDDHLEKISYVFMNCPLLMIILFFDKTSLIITLFTLTSACFLGGIIYSMILGHWYLVVPKLSIQPLRTSLKLIGFFLFIKLLLVGITLWGILSFEGSSFYWMMLSMRICWGYFAIAIMLIFTWKLVKMKSLQSATGLLYTMTFFGLMGELIAGFLYFEYGIML